MQPVLVVIAGFALLAALLGWSRWLAGRRWAAAGHLLLGCAMAAIVAGGWPLATYLASYEPLLAERPVAELFFERIGPGRYRVALTRLPDGRMQVVELVGDQWRLDLRTLGWSERAGHLGLEPRCRIERLASRSAPTDAPGVPAGISHELANGDEALPWLAGVGAGRGTPLVVTRELPGPWQPMADGARFDLRLTAGNAIAVDPLNEAAADSLGAR